MWKSWNGQFCHRHYFFLSRGIQLNSIPLTGTAIKYVQLEHEKSQRQVQLIAFMSGVENNRYALALLFASGPADTNLMFSITLTMFSSVELQRKDDPNNLAPDIENCATVFCSHSLACFLQIILCSEVLGLSCNLKVRLPLYVFRGDSLPILGFWLSEYGIILSSDLLFSCFGVSNLKA